MMRKCLLILSALFFLIASLPSLSFADTSITGKTDCPAGSAAIDPSGQQSFGATPDASKDIQAYIYKAESCASACFDEHVAVQIGVSSPATVLVAVTATNQCGMTPISQPAKAQPPRGCSKGQTQPQITLDVPELSFAGTTYLKQQTIGPKSRCYGAVAGTVSGIAQGGISMNTNPAAIQTNFDALASLSTQAPVVPQTGTIAGNDTLVSALTASGINASDAQKIAADPVSAQALINAYATGNKDTIQDTVQDAAAKAGISLNDGVYDNIESLSDAKIQTAQTALAPLADQSGTVIPSTFSAPANTAPTQPLKGGANAQMIAAAEQQYNLPSGLLGNICNSESRCTSICSSSSSACGMYQYTSSTWTGVTAQMCSQGVSSVAQYCNGGSISASLRTDPYVATQVAGWNISQNLQQYAPLIAQTGIDQGTAAYIMQGLGTGGASKFFQAYIQNPNMSTADFLYQTQPGAAATIIATNGNLYNGQTLQGTVNQFAANLGSAPASSAPVGGALIGAGSPFSTNTNILGGSLLGANVTSPFANVSPIYSTPGLGSSPAAYTPIQYAQTQQAAPVQSAPSTGSTIQNAASTGQSGIAVDQIIAQPKVVPEGSPITVSWSSVGMSAASPCQVLENGSVISSSANEGVQVVDASTTGTLAFTLSCVAQGTGALVPGSASVTVQL
jgi:hypothetical protein